MLPRKEYDRWCLRCQDLRDRPSQCTLDSPYYSSADEAELGDSFFLRDLFNSAARGCPICRLVRHRVVSQRKYSRVKGRVCLTLLTDPTVGEPSHLRVELSGARRGKSGPARQSEILEFKLRSRDHLEIARLRSATKGSIALHEQRQDDGSLNIRKSLAQLVEVVISPWINDVNAKVEQDQTRLSGLMKATPTRLIQVLDGDSQCLRLHVTSAGENVALQYLTLSYQWGEGKQTATTTRDNYSDRLLHIDLKTLPRTIQDAILVTRALKFSFLWVDALCIIQQDPKFRYLGDDADWNHEASRMGSYYWNSFLTLAASHSTRSSKGFLGSRNAYRYTLEDVLVLPEGSRYDQSHIYENKSLLAVRKLRTYTKETLSKKDWYIQPEYPSFDQELLGSSLYSRAWTFQERLLSRCILHFTEELVFWETSSGQRSIEGAPESCTSSIIDPQTIDPNTLIRFYHLSDTTGDSFILAWMTVIKQYNRMQLSFEKDRLIAIQGIMDLLTPLHPNGYSAGIFREQSIRQLLWAQSSSERPESKNDEVPSWSWASVPGIDLDFPEFGITMNETWPAKVENVEDFPLIRTKGKTHPRGTLTIRGVLRGCILNSDRFMSTSRMCDRYKDEHTGDFPLRRGGEATYFGYSEHHKISLTWDATSVTPMSDHSRILCLALRLNPLDKTVQGLVLSRVSNGLEYKRVGYFSEECDSECWQRWVSLPNRVVRIN